MVLQTSGSISLAQIASEHGGTAPHSLTEYYRGAGVYDMPLNTSITTSGTTRMTNFYGSQKVRLFTLSSTTNYNLLSSYTSTYGAPTSAVAAKVVIPDGVTVGSTVSSVAAIDIGTFPSGSYIEIENNGNIWGAGGLGGGGGTVYNGGSSNGGVGGDAINADYAGITVRIKNAGQIYAGGGGGAGGLKGATGANGVNGYRPDTYIYNSNNYKKSILVYPGEQVVAVWNGIQIYNQKVYYLPNPFTGTDGKLYWDGFKVDYVVQETISGWNYTKLAASIPSTGGTGGTGGNGGTGGTGWGYNNQTTTTGGSGQSGAPGSPSQGGTATAGQTGASGISGANGGLAGSSGNATVGGGNGGSAGYRIRGLGVRDITIVSNTGTMVGL